MVTISTIQFKRGKKEALEKALVGKNILLSGEPVFEIDTNKFKIGDGKSEYKDLPYISDSVQSGNLFFAETIYEFPKTGEDDKLYVATAENNTYFWRNGYKLASVDSREINAGGADADENYNRGMKLGI